MYTLLCLVSVTLIIVHSEIFLPVRNFVKHKSDTLGYWITCPMCFGFWVGLIGGLLVGSNFVGLALLTSLFSWTIYNIVTAFDAIGNYFTVMTTDGVEKDE